ncbi:MAG: type II toxin-antitoxin system VapC family toxin [Deltaproteobacteria bacterium]|nr:type II toxin-antitoxin system VapC family toxin [Deltaproteobacteria bacterium]
MTRALADTSVFVSIEQDRPRRRPMPDEILVSVVTVGELQLGVLMASDGATRARRLKTLTYVESTFEPVPVDAAAAREWARLVAHCRRRQHRVPVNDLWIAATAIVHDLSVLTQDADYDRIPGLRVVKL